MPKPLIPGVILKERYIIKSVIGQGGMGCVYLAEDDRLEGRQCAVKEVEHDQNVSDELLKQGRDQFQREATILARLDHPNLPKVSDFFSEETRDYLVMDFIPGEDLRTIISQYNSRGEFIPEQQVLQWASQIADAIHFLHSQETPILHRDIKPGNMKLTPQGLIKLVDFGLVKLLAPGELTITVLQGRGTALYTPLEQYGGDTGHTDIRTDIYAFGATLYHLITGTPPVEARERFLTPGVLEMPQEINPAISSRTQRAILWSMGIHPKDRPADVEAFRNALLGDWNPKAPPNGSLPRPTLVDLLPTSIEWGLAIATIGLVLVTFLLTWAGT